MCGLVGSLGGRADQQELASRASAMADRIRHRGPDDEGVWVDAEAGVALGHRRLSILDLSPAGHQPMLSASGRWVVAYNGELYNHLALRRELEGRSGGLAWRGTSDTETLLAAVEAWGVEGALSRSVGMFAIALWDREGRELWLARDRMGEKPLYYGFQGEALLFGSDLSALRAHPAFRGELDRDALALYLRLNYVPEPYSIYRGIRKLEPGTYVRVSAERPALEPRAYWSLRDAVERGEKEPYRGDDARAVDELEALLGDAVAGQMLSDVPIGALLSGGIDSSLTTALMQTRSARPIRTFTIGFEEKAYDEADHARAVARHLGTDHTELRLSPREALEIIPRLPAIYSEPFGDSSQLPTFLVMRLAREHVTVALSGDGGDELFGGYNRYFLGRRAWRALRWIPTPGRRMIGSALTAIPSDALNRVLRAPGAWAGVALPGDKLHKIGTRLRGLRDLDDLYVSMVTEWAGTSRIVRGAATPRSLLDERFRWPRTAEPVARMMALDGVTYLPGDILVKVDRAAMAVSLETRAPFLDHRVVEFAWRLPMEKKLRDGRGKWILRQVLDRHVPRALVERPKMGFGVPLEAWLRGTLRAWGEELLSEERLEREGYLDPKPIRDAWERHQRGEASLSARLWSVLMFQAWLEATRASG